ncbi:MAG: 30S ribosomal protein S17 [SAR202 cluster bacterium]|nr:30S ribosomal protein S17 [SAR202 cluster bacterium]
MAGAPGRRKVQIGRVVSDKMNKTVVVEVARQAAHPIYGKSVRRVSRFKAHSEQNQYRVGDLVRIEETKPLSKDKRWRVSALVQRTEAPQAEQVAAAAAADVTPAAEEAKS